MFTDFDAVNFSNVIDIIMKKAKQKNMEVTVTINSDGSGEYTIRPFVPMRYTCPYSCYCDKEEKK